MHYHLANKDTIVALATPPGAGAIAVVRLSGVDALSVAGKLFRPLSAPFEDIEPRTAVFGKLEDNNAVLDEVLLTIFPAPHSYTGEDVVEISCHGSLYIQQRVMQALVRHGARMAQKGEFTLRAFLNGKMDLSQAEAVADLVSADSESAHRLAMQQMRGGYSDELKHLRGQLIHLASLLELELDFSEEDVEFANRGQLRELITLIKAQLSRLIASFALGNAMKTGIPVVIAGKPNAGKSTLLNALLNEERAIVSHIAGTTRDTIEEVINLNGIKFRFIDTAGIRQTTDAIESIGVNRTFEKINQSPLLVYIFDITSTTPAALKEELNELRKAIHAEQLTIIAAANKIDAGTDYTAADYPEGTLFISAKEKKNINVLTDALLSHSGAEQLSLQNAVVTNARHAEELQKANDALQKVVEGLNTQRTADLLSTDVRDALYHLGLLTGEITTDNLLENIFEKFCIGK